VIPFDSRGRCIAIVTNLVGTSLYLSTPRLA
jgi:hypothetical protein